MLWIILAAVLVLLVLLANLPLGVRVAYDPGGLLVKLRAGPLRIRVFPLRKKKGPKKPKKKKKKPAKPKPDLKQLWPLIRALIPVGKEAMANFRRRLTIQLLSLHLIWGEEDPADAAIHYGYAWAGVEAGLSFLEANCPIRRRDVRLELDCRRDKPEAAFCLELTVKLGQIMAVGIPAAVQAGKVLLQYKKEQKKTRTTPEEKPSGQLAET